MHVVERSEEHRQSKCFSHSLRTNPHSTMPTRFALTARPSASESARPVATFSHKKAANTACERFRDSTEYVLEVVEIQPFSMKALSVPQNVSMSGVQRELAKIRGMFKVPLW